MRRSKRRERAEVAAGDGVCHVHALAAHAHRPTIRGLQRPHELGLRQEDGELGLVSMVARHLADALDDGLPPVRGLGYAIDAAELGQDVEALEVDEDVPHASHPFI